MTDQVISGCLRDHHNSETFAMYCEDCKLRKDPERCERFRENSKRVQFSLVSPLAGLVNRPTLSSGDYIPIPEEEEEGEAKT